MSRSRHLKLPKHYGSNQKSVQRALALPDPCRRPPNRFISFEDEDKRTAINLSVPRMHQPLMRLLFQFSELPLRLCPFVVKGAEGGQSRGVELKRR